MAALEQAADGPAERTVQRPGDPGAGAARPMAARTRLLLEAPIAPTLLRLAAPNVLVMLMQSSVGLIETYFVGRLGTAALAGVALVFPIVMLMQMMSAGAMGGGIASAIARALGAGRRADADALAWHALLIAGLLGGFFTLAVIGGGPWLYRAMGGDGATLDAALTYSNVVFAGALLLWVMNTLASILRGTGNMLLPAAVICVGALVLVPLSPALIFGWGPFPALGVAGGGVAVVSYYAVGALVLGACLRARASLVRLTLTGIRLRWALFYDILRVGAVASLITVQTNLTVVVLTGLVGSFGAAAIAGYGIGARLEYLLVPLVFGFGAPLVAMVGTSIGAGDLKRAQRVAWLGGAIAGAVTEAIGVGAALAPGAWIAPFSSDPGVVAAATTYLRIAGPCYGFFGLGMALYFAAQGAGRLTWPFLANLTRLAVATGGGWFAFRWLDGGLAGLFGMLAAALVLFGTINAVAVAAGSWRGAAR
ncbi:MAG TPA: MATE family efflux transporter [Candidatus Sulfotelmatobacter sp.]|nr:MATE family efflux transporter [Candidatus Sulfotelmatobacter sp.]